MTPEERAKDFYTLPPNARTIAALTRMIRQAEDDARGTKLFAIQYDEKGKVVARFYRLREQRG